MAVLGQTPVIPHLNDTLPSAPSGAAAVLFQAGSAYPDPNNPAQSVKDVSGYVPQAVPASGSPLSAPVPGVVLYDASGSVYKYLGADGDWHPVAKSKAGVTSNFLTAYDETTGLFSAAQPADADLTLSNVTTNDVSTTKHGFAPKLPNDATKYMDGTGAYSVPAGGGGGGSGWNVLTPGSNTTYMGQSNAYLAGSSFALPNRPCVLHVIFTGYRSAISQQLGFGVALNSSNGYFLWQESNANIEIDYYVSGSISFGNFLSVGDNVQQSFQLEAYILIGTGHTGFSLNFRGSFTPTQSTITTSNDTRVVLYNQTAQLVIFAAGTSNIGQIQYEIL